jgi:hypothetical protein
MARVVPYHSSKNPGVYHVCTKCTEGNNIESQYKKQGTGDGHMCAHCKRLTSSDGC